MAYFSDDIKIAGQAIKAGTYSIFTIPVQGGDWSIMFHGQLIKKSE